MQTTVKEPTPRMHDVADVIAATRKATGRGPSYREIADKLQLSIGRVVDLCYDAQQRGLIDFTRGEPRSFRVVGRCRGTRQAKGQERP